MPSPWPDFQKERVLRTRGRGKPRPFSLSRSIPVGAQVATMAELRDVEPQPPAKASQRHLHAMARMGLVIGRTGAKVVEQEAGHGAAPQLVVAFPAPPRSEEHTSELQSHVNLVCRLL